MVKDMIFRVKASEIRHHNVTHASHLIERQEWKELERMRRDGRLPDVFFKKAIATAKASGKNGDVTPLKNIAGFD